MNNDKQEIEGGVPISENEVIVRLWRSSYFKTGVGHISLQTKKNYISFWPAGPINKEAMEDEEELLKPIDGKFNTYDEDLIAERKNEDEQVSLNSLNSEDMDKFYLLFKKDNKCNWNLIGSSIESQSELNTSLSKVDKSKISNCAGLTLALLAAGGHSIDLKKYSQGYRDTVKVLSPGFGAIITGLLLLRFIGEKAGSKHLSFFYEGTDNAYRALHYTCIGLIALGLITVLCSTGNLTYRCLKGTGMVYTPEGVFSIVKNIEKNELQKNQETSPLLKSGLN